MGNQVKEVFLKFIRAIFVYYYYSLGTRCLVGNNLLPLLICKISDPLEKKYAEEKIILHRETC